MLFKNGEVAATKVGAMPKTKLYEWVEESLRDARARVIHCMAAAGVLHSSV